MATWKKASPELVDAFHAALPDDPAVERRKMFGFDCAFVNGQMFTGLCPQGMVVRLPEDLREEILALPGTSRFEPMPGRVMREYAVLSPAILSSSKELARWTRRAFVYASSLPAKRAKSRRKRTSGAAKSSAKPPRSR